MTDLINFHMVVLYHYHHDDPYFTNHRINCKVFTSVQLQPLPPRFSMKTSLFNLGLVLGGVLITCVGLFRAYPIKMDARFMWSSGPMILALIITLTLAIGIGGTKFFLAGMESTVRTSAGFILIIALLMPVIGFSTPIAHHFEDAIGQLLSGRFGYPIAFITALIAPSGNSFAALVTKLWTTKELRPLLLYFMTVTPLASISIFYIRRLGLSSEIVGAMYRANLSIALGAMPFFWIWGKFFMQ